MFAGLGVAAAIQDRNRAAANVIGISALLAGAIGVVVGVWIMPSTEEQDGADVRHKLLVDGEDDLDAAARGVDRLNQAARRECAAPASSGGH